MSADIKLILNVKAPVLGLVTVRNKMGLGAVFVEMMFEFDHVIITNVH